MRACLTRYSTRTTNLKTRGLAHARDSRNGGRPIAAVPVLSGWRAASRSTATPRWVDDRANASGSPVDNYTARLSSAIAARVNWEQQQRNAPSDRARPRNSNPVRAVRRVQSQAPSSTRSERTSGCVSEGRRRQQRNAPSDRARFGRRHSLRVSRVGACAPRIPRTPLARRALCRWQRAIRRALAGEATAKRSAGPDPRPAR